MILHSPLVLLFGLFLASLAFAGVPEPLLDTHGLTDGSVLLLNR